MEKIINIRSKCFKFEEEFNNIKDARIAVENNRYLGWNSFKLNKNNKYQV